MLDGVRALVPSEKLEALVLGGGYGRGQGGVLKTETGDEPYNDLEFYVFLRGNRLRNGRLFGVALRELGDRLSPGARLHVEFKVDSLPRLRRSPVTMFSYDLVSGHRVLWGGEHRTSNIQHPTSNGRQANDDKSLDVGCSQVFHDCQHHLNAFHTP